MCAGWSLQGESFHGPQLPLIQTGQNKQAEVIQTVSFKY